jgi:competence protein ComEC
VGAVSHRPSFNSSPLAPVAASLAAGVLAARALAAPLRVCLLCAALCTAAAFLSTIALKKTVWASLWMLAAFGCLGATLAVLEDGAVGGERVRRLYEEGRLAAGEPLELTGVLRRAPEWSPDGFRLTLRVERIGVRLEVFEASGAVELFAPLFDESAAVERARREDYEALELRRGARVRVLAALSREEKFRNHGGGSLAEYLSRRGLDATGIVKSPLLVERLDDERVLLPLVWLDDARARLLDAINRLFSTETASVLNASMLGNREGLTRATGERFREGGTFHVLVISGLHITFIGVVILAAARRLTRRRAWQFACSVAFVWAYAVAVGAESSVVRAALMFTSVALAPVLARRASNVNALGAAALALLIWQPSGLFDPSFQLTFVSVLIILTVAWPLVSKLKAVGEWRPSQATPYPPVCPRWWRTLGEILFWRERSWRRELARETYSYKLFKHPLAARLERWRVQPLLRYAFVTTLVSACVQAGMLPLMVVYFHRFSFASLVLNVMVGACLVLLSFVSLAALAVSQLSAQLAAPLVWLAEHLAWLMTHSVDPFTTSGVASIRLPEYTGTAAAVYPLFYVPLVVLAHALARWRPVPDAIDGETNASACDERRRGVTYEAETPSAGHAGARFSARFISAQRVLISARSALSRRLTKRVVVRVAAVTLVSLFVLIIFHPFSARRADGRLRVDFLDVGQGDAALLTMPDGTTLLIDGGGRAHFGGRGRAAAAEDDRAPFERDTRSIGEAVVSEYLWWRGLDTVDYVLATHAHADHIEGLNDVVKNFRVRAVLAGRAPEDDAEFQRFAATARARGVPVFLVGRSDVLSFGAVEMDVLWPPREASAHAASGNDDSVVLRVRFGSKVFLLTGDIEAKGESALVSAARGDLRSDAVKVAHHGSRTSSTGAFVSATRPAFAVIPVGLDSQFGHPHGEVLARWHAIGAQILTTGQRGTITLTTDGQDLTIETYVK